MYNHFLKPILFSIQPEKAHYLAMKAADTCRHLPFGSRFLRKLAGDIPDIPINILGLTFKNKVGLAAGFDKNGEYIEVLKHLGFGHIEVGTVTPRPQPGNDLPRLFRLKEDYALINRMGFNNKGVHHLVENLRQLPSERPILGGNIGKNKDTPNEQAWQDYIYCFKYLHPHIDYFTINLSSPNTPGLRALQEKEPLIKILSEIQQYNQGLEQPKPILLKISPDNSQTVLDDIIQVAQECRINGIIATNTTIERKGLITPECILNEIGNGGLSGKPLFNRSLEVVRYLKTALPDEMVIIGVGGISDHASYMKMLDSGADLVQIYTTFIYQGMKTVKKIVQQ